MVGSSQTAANRGDHDSHSHAEDKLVRVFHMFDVNRAGHIDLGALVTALKELGVTTCLYTARRILETIDLDGSGSIELSDFIRFFEKASDVDTVKDVLSKEALKYLNYRVDAESGDPHFSVKYRIPPCLKPSRHLAGHADVVQSVAWLGGGRFVSCSLDGSVAVWGGDHPAVQSTFKPTDVSAYTMSLLPGDGRRALLGFAESTQSLCVVDLESSSVLHALAGLSDEAVMTSDVSFHRSAVGLKGGICMTHDLDRVDAPGSILSRSNATIESVSFNKTGSLLAVGDHLGMITLVDVRSAAPVSSLEGCSGRLSCVRFKSDHQLLTGGDDFVVRMFDDRKLREGAIGAFLGHTSAVSSIAVLDGLVFSGSLDGSVRVWSDAQVSGHGVKFLGAETEEHDATIAKAALIGHSQAVKSIAARKNGKAVEVLTGSSDTCVNIFVLN